MNAVPGQSSLFVNVAVIERRSNGDPLPWTQVSSHALDPLTAVTAAERAAQHLTGVFGFEWARR